MRKKNIIRYVLEGILSIFALYLHGISFGWIGSVLSIFSFHLHPPKYGLEGVCYFAKLNRNIQLNIIILQSIQLNIIILTRGDIFPTALSPSTWVKFHSCQLICNNPTREKNSRVKSYLMEVTAEEDQGCCETNKK